MERSLTFTGLALIMAASSSCTEPLQFDQDLDNCGASACCCSRDYEPVCGTGEKTFNNACYALCEGAQIFYDGQCEQPQEEQCPAPAGSSPILETVWTTQPEVNCLKDDALLRPAAGGPPLTIVTSASEWRALYRSECATVISDAAVADVNFAERLLAIIQLESVATAQLSWTVSLADSAQLGFFIPLSGVAPPEGGVVVGIAIPKDAATVDVETLTVKICAEQLCEGCDPPP